MHGNDLMSDYVVLWLCLMQDLHFAIRSFTLIWSFGQGNNQSLAWHFQDLPKQKKLIKKHGIS